MKPTPVVALVLIAVLLDVPAGAKDAPNAPAPVNDVQGPTTATSASGTSVPIPLDVTRAQPESDPQVLLPLKLAGSSTGKATAELGAGVQWSAGDRWVDLSLIATTSIATDNGVATLLGISKGEATQSLPWDAGVSFSLIRLHAPENNRQPLGSGGWVEDAIKGGVGLCTQTCQGSEDDPFCQSKAKFAKARLKDWLKTSVETLSAEQMCDSQREAVMLADAEAKHSQRTMDSAAAATNQSMEDKEVAHLANENKKLVRLAKRKDALSACIQECTNGSTGTFCRLPQVKEAVDASYLSYSPDRLCARAKEAYTRTEDAHGRRLFPPFITVMGFKVGRQTFDYRSTNDAATPLLTKHSSTEVPWSTGVTFTGLPMEGRYAWVMQGQVSVQSKWVPSTNTVKSCSPAGDVPRKEPPAVSATDPGETCTETTLGAPTNTKSVSLSFVSGIVDDSRGFWRASLGPEINIPFKADKRLDVSFSIKAPVYFNFISVRPGGSKLDYSGMLRLTPAFGSIPLDGGGRGFSASVELALLGDRPMFLSKFDEL